MTAGTVYSGIMIASSTSFFGGTDPAQTFLSTIPSGGPPLDGQTPATGLTQSLAEWKGRAIVFAWGGNYSLSLTSGGSSFLLPTKVVVRGVKGTASMRLFCQSGGITNSCQSQIAVNLGSISDRVNLVPYPSGVCGNGQQESTNLIFPPVVVDGKSELFNFNNISETPITFSMCFGPYPSPQPIGVLIFTSVMAIDPETNLLCSVFSTLRIVLSIFCGSGGCSSNPTSPRIKLIDSGSISVSNRCESASQSQNYMSPLNCVNSTTCISAPSLNNGTTISFNGIQILANINNFVPITSNFDVCFSDSFTNWIHAGSLTVNPIQVKFTVAGATVNPVPLKLAGTITIFGFGNSNGSFRSSGSSTRKIKFLQDNARIATGPYDCFSQWEPAALVSGHECTSLTHCDGPVGFSKSEVSYGSDSISFNSAGWIAVCFCNEQCNAGINWLVVGWLLAAGPEPRQQWNAVQGLPFSINITGFGLREESSQVRITDSSSAACSLVNSKSIIAPDSGWILTGSKILSLLSLKSGATQVTFPVNEPHGLVRGDTVQLFGVRTGDAMIDSMFNNFHSVSIVDPHTIELPLLSFPPPAQFLLSISLNAAGWRRTNMASLSGITATAPGTYTVCWLSSGTIAGNLKVSAPPVITGSLGLGTTVPYVVAPVVLQFTTSANSLYSSSAFGKTMAKVVFSKLQFLEPMDAMGNAIDFSALANTKETASLDICGLLFSEFIGPFPCGCFATSDEFAANFFVVFNQLNGIGPVQTISICINAIRYPGLSSTNPGGLGAVQVWMLTDSSNDPATAVIEVAALRPPSSQTVVALTGNAALIARFNILPNPACACSGTAICDPSLGCSFKFQIEVYSGSVLGGSVLRILLFPLLDWSIQLNPLVTCISDGGGQSFCSKTAPLAIAENVIFGILTKGQGGNVLRIQLPPDLPPITSGNKFVFSVSSLKVPKNGFFSNFFGMEIFPPNNLIDPVFLISNFTSFQITPQIAHASLLTRDGNNAPFRGDKRNTIFIKLVFGFKISKKAMISIKLPIGYSCKQSNLNDGTAVPSSLYEFMGKVPSGRGVIGQKSQESEWISSLQAANFCVLKLKSSTAVFSGATIYMNLTVDNPTFALQQKDPENVWSVQVFQDGFFSLESNFSNSFAVLGILKNVSIIPLNFAQNNLNDLFVFFATESDCKGSATQIQIQAPSMLFEANCFTLDLSSEYFVAETSVLVRPLSVRSCARSPSGTAVLTLKEPIEASQTYGLRIRIMNPSYAQETTETNWIWKVTSFSDLNSPCDASRSTAMNIADPQGLPWAVFPFSFSSGVELASLVPESISLITVSPIRVPVTSAVESIKITAPVGYVWDFSPADLSSNLPITILPIAPLTDPFNALVVRNLKRPLQEGVTYWLRAKIRVPQYTVTNSANVFAIEIGNISASIVPGPQVAALINGSIVSYESSIANSSSLICLQVHLITRVPKGGSIVVVPPLNFNVSSSMQFVSTGGLPPDSVCISEERKSGGIQILVIAGPSEFGPGLIKFCMSFTNPEVPQPAGTWTISTNGKASTILDASTSFSGFPVTSFMSAGVVSPTDSRPFAINQVIFTFTPPTIPMSSGPYFVKITAPDGGFTCTGCSRKERFAIMSFQIPFPAGETVEISMPFVNPGRTPKWNFWSIEYAQSMSSLPLKGFEIWTFSDVSVTAFDQSANSFTNVTVTLTPFNSIPPGGYLSFIAPVGFVISQNCTAANSQNVKFNCNGNPTVPNLFSLTLSTTPMVFNTSYAISIEIRNPKIPMHAGVWNVSSFNNKGGLMDSAACMGYSVVGRVEQFTLVSLSSVAGHDWVSLRIAFRLSSSVHDFGHSLAMRLPLGYMLNLPGSSICSGYALAPASASFSRKPHPRCVGASIEWASDFGFASSVLYTVSLTSRNPPSTPLGNIYSIVHSGPGSIGIVEMGTFAGPELIPKFVSISIDLDGAMGSGAISRILIRVTPFSFADSVVVKSANDSYSIPIQLEPFLETEIIIPNIVNPQIPGQSYWTVSSYANGVLADQVSSVPGPIVVGNIQVSPTSSSVSPRKYGSFSTILTFSLSCSVDIPANSTLHITPPPGYVLIPGSFESVSAVAARTSGQVLEGGEYVVQVGNRLIQAWSLLGFSVIGNLPKSVQNRKNWRFDIFLIESTSVLIATNDGLFNGFDLISEIPFSVFPSSPTPAAQVSVRIAYNVPTHVTASSFISLRVTAPIGYSFPSSTTCLSSGAAASCIGTSNVATIDLEGNFLHAGPGQITLLVTNPSSTPLINVWQLAVYVDHDPSSFTNLNEAKGFAIRSMTARYIGQNRLGFSGSAFFTLQLSSNSLNSYFQIIITPRLGSGYIVACGNYIVGLASAPSCSSSSAGNGVRITISKANLNPSSSFTVGVTVINPPSQPVNNALNGFSLTVLDPLGATIDANEFVPGPIPLVIIPLTQQGFSYDKAFARTLSNVVFSFSVTAESACNADPSKAFTWLSIKIRAPDDFMLAAATNVKVDQTLLPLKVSVQGNTLTVLLDPKNPIMLGTYSVAFSVMNPGNVPINNFWIFSIIRGIDVVLFTNVSEGYQFGTAKEQSLKTTLESFARVRIESLPSVIAITFCLLNYTCLH